MYFSSVSATYKVLRNTHSHKAKLANCNNATYTYSNFSLLPHQCDVEYI